MSKDGPRQDARQELYKNNSRSPYWKEQFRRRCLERLKDSRDRHLSSRRSINNMNENYLSASNVKVEQRYNCEIESIDRIAHTCDQENIQELDIIMKEEFNRLKDELSSQENKGVTVVQGNLHSNGQFCNTRHVKNNGYSATGNSGKAAGNFCCSENDLDLWYEEIYLSLKAELEKVQKTNEEAHLQSLQDEFVKEEEELCSAIEALCTKVTCPLCGKFNLIEQKNVILCRCGLKIDIEQDCITLKNVKENLAAGTDEHSQKCESQPTFSLSQKFGISNLLMSCKDCEFLFVIV